MPPRVILASSSSFRRDLFRLYFPDLFISDETSFISPDIDEKAIRDPDPKKLCLKVAEAKCDLGVLTKHPLLTGQGDDEDVVVITCDQIVICRGQLREKPSSDDEARGFLRSYSEGDAAECVNGIVVHHVRSGKRLKELDTSTVRFRPFPDSVAEEMISSGLARKTAGAFSISNVSLAKYLDSIEGSVPSVEGLPVHKLRDMMSQICPDLKCAFPLYGNINCVLFDMDGLLLDTETFYTVAHQKILDRFGLQFTWEVKSKMMGRKAMDASQIMIDHYDIGDKMSAGDLVREREEILDGLFPDSELLPGVERLLLHLHSHNVPMAVATGSNKRYFLMKTLKHKELFDRVMHHVVTGDCVKESKPNPEIFQKALQQFGTEKEVVDGEQVLVFEDAPLGVEAGIAAGMKTVMISDVKPTDGLTPTLYIPSMLYFLPEQWGLPPF